MRRRPRGILLITVMFLVLLVGLFGSAMLTNGPAMARMANQAADEVLAQRAAETGAAYVRLQLRMDAEWKGDLNTTTVDLPDFKVSEQDGNVLGWIKDSNGQVSMFRIRFNYQDGNPGADELPDPPASHLINTTFLSVNNVVSSADMTVPDINATTFAVDDPAVGVNNAPEGCVFLRIEGLAGPGLGHSTGPTDQPGTDIVSSRTLRAIYAASVDDGIPDAALSAGNGIDLEVENGAEVKASTGPADQEVKLRSKKELAIATYADSAQTMTFDPTVKGKITTESGTVEGNLSGDYDVDPELANKDFHNITWDQVPKASSDGAEAVQLPAGIYVSDYSGVYHYYDMTFAEYKAAPIDTTTGLRTGGTVLDNHFSQVRTDSLGGAGLETIAPDADNGLYAHTLSITKDVNFNSSATGKNDVFLMTPSGRELYEDDPGDLFIGSATGLPGFEFTAIKMEDTTITSPGDLGILVDVEGINASLTAEGDATVAAPSVKLEVDGVLPDIVQLDQRLSVYTKGDLNVSTYLHTPEFYLDLGSFGSINIPEIKQYGNLNLQGLLYSWGDAEIYGGTPGEQFVTAFSGNPNYGEFNLAGALVAYGGDPEDGTPGSAGNGKISYHGLKATIDYDASKLVTDPETITETGGLQALTRKSYGFEY